MTYDPHLHHRRSIRLPGYDYAAAGGYFITICTQHRECLFGEVVDGEMRLNEAGKMVAECWQWLSTQFPQIAIDAWVVMPNHFHGVLVITDVRRGGSGTGGKACHGRVSSVSSADAGRGGSRTAPTIQTREKPLGRLIGAFKTVSTKRLNLLRHTPGLPLWQRNYYEHVIRNEDDLNHICHYIANNPLKWAEDENHPLVTAPCSRLRL